MVYNYKNDINDTCLWSFYSKCPPWFAIHFSALFLTSITALLHISTSTLATALSKASFNSFKSLGFGVYTWDFKNPQRKKSNGFRSGDLAG